MNIFKIYFENDQDKKNPCFPCFHTTEHDRNFLKNDISGEGSSNYEEHNLFTFNLAYSLPFHIFFSYKEIRFDIVRYEILSLLFCGDHFKIFSPSEFSEVPSNKNWGWPEHDSDVRKCGIQPPL